MLSSSLGAPSQPRPNLQVALFSQMTCTTSLSNFSSPLWSSSSFRLPRGVVTVAETLSRLCILCVYVISVVDELARVDLSLRVDLLCAALRRHSCAEMEWADLFLRRHKCVATQAKTTKTTAATAMIAISTIESSLTALTRRVCVSEGP